MNSVTVYRDYDQAALDLQYNNRAAAPGFADHIQRYRTLTDEAKLKLKCIENLAYGTAPEETLDLYRALQDSAPIFQGQEAARRNSEPIAGDREGGS